MPLGLVALNSDVISPRDGTTVDAGAVEVRGYAFAGGERHVDRVDVSIDGGTTWAQAELLDDLGRWAWRHWRINLELPAGQHQVVVRAWDSSAATQPEDEASLWNPKGYVNNARPRIRLRTVARNTASACPGEDERRGTASLVSVQPAAIRLTVAASAAGDGPRRVKGRTEV